MNHLERIHLEIILAVEEEGSMTAAAHTLHLTQSALSHSISKLEDQVGVKVWSRDGRKLHLTQSGKSILATAKRLLPQFLRAEELLHQYSSGERGVLRIGMECHPCYQWLQGVTKTYLKEWPHVDLDVIQKFQFAGISALLSHEIDLIVTPDPHRRSGLTFTPVFEYEQVLVVGANHPFNQLDYLEPDQLSAETLFTYPVCSDRLDIFSNFLTPAGHTVKKQQMLEATEIILQMVECHRGVTALPRWLVDQYRELYDIESIQLGKEGLKKQLFLGVRTEDLDSAYIKGFFRQAMASLG